MKKTTMSFPSLPGSQCPSIFSESTDSQISRALAPITSNNNVPVSPHATYRESDLALIAKALTNSMIDLELTQGDVWDMRTRRKLIKTAIKSLAQKGIYRQTLCRVPCVRTVRRVLSRLINDESLKSKNRRYGPAPKFLTEINEFILQNP